MKLNKKILSALDENDFRICGEDEQGGAFVVELEWYSPAGEDCLFSVYFDGTSRGFVRGFAQEAEDFDPDEHAELWIDHRGENGCPSSIRELIDDADAIKAELERMADLLRETVQGE